MNFKKGSKKVLNAWAFYDFANSVYSLTIVTAVFPLFIGAYLKGLGTDKINAFGLHLSYTALINCLTAFGFLIVAILSPILSGIADYRGSKKFFMRFFCYLGSLSCVLLYFFTVDHIYLSLLAYLTGLIGFWGSLVFYNSYLPDIAYKNQQDAVSAKGFSLGYVGCVILLLINLGMILSVPDSEKLEMMRISFIMVGLWWFGFSHISYKYLPNFTNKNKITKAIVFNGIKKLNIVWKDIKTQKTLKRYLGSFFVFSMAIQTVMLVASFYGEKEIDWEGNGFNKTIGLIISMLAIQVVAILGALLTAKISSKLGNIKTLIIINCMWVLICIGAYFVVTPIQFFTVAGFVGLTMGGVQSLGRSTYAKLLPDTKDTTSYFSFFDVTEKISIVIGMAMFATIEIITGSMRLAILFLVLIFIVALVLLFRIPKDKII